MNGPFRAATLSSFSSREGAVVDTDIVHQSVEELHTTFDRTDLEVEWRKIREKIEEARYNPGDLRPLVDCIYSLLLAARSRGYHVEAVLTELERLSKEILDHRWKKMEDGTYRAC